MKVIDLRDGNINFISKISCFVNKTENNTVTSSTSKNQKIILKPIFYKVKDLQNIVLRSTLPQNIGINLSEYMSKVESFKIIIGNNEFIESGNSIEVEPLKITNININTTKTVDLTGTITGGMISINTNNI